MFEEITLQAIGALLFVGCPFLIFYLLIKAGDKTSSTMIPKKKIVSYRYYWKNPGLISKLSREQRNRVEGKFFELVEKGRKQCAKRKTQATM